MEPPSKKLRLSQAPYDDNDDDDANLDELSMSPTQFEARQDPLYQLDKGRAKAATRLKSAFERIFEKYERDFTGVGDEIDLETGEVVVNNGHLQSLEDERDRREGSVSSNEEERIMRGKNGSSAQSSHSHSKSLIQTKPLAQNSSLGFHPGLSQPNMANEAYHQPLPPGMPPNVFGSPNPFIFGPPMFGNLPVDPLWQTPEVSMSLYQDRFGFMSQTMGYPPTFGYGYGPMLTGANYGNTPLSGHSHHPVQKKLPCTKAPGRMFLPRIAPGTDDSEEDDILLGGNTQDPDKDAAAAAAAATGDSQPPTPNKVAGTTIQADKEAKKTITSTLEENPQNSRRGKGRPKKMAVLDNPPESEGKTTRKDDGSTDTSSTSQTPKPAITVNPATASLFASSMGEGESILARQIAAKLAQIKANKRRAHLKRRHLRPEIVPIPNHTEEAANGASSLLLLDTNGSIGYVETNDALYSEVKQPKSSRGNSEDSNKIISIDTDVSPNQDNYEELLLDEGDRDTGERAESNSTEFHSAAENSEQLDSLFSNSETNTKETEEMSEDNETISPNEPEQPGNLAVEEEPVNKPHDLSPDTHLRQESDQKADSQINITEQTYNAIETEPKSHNYSDNGILDTFEDTQVTNTTTDDVQETAQSPDIPVELAKEVTELPDPAQEEKQPLQPDIVESELHLDDTINELGLTDQASNALDSLDEEEAMPPPTQRKLVSLQSKKRPITKISKLAIRPPPAQDDSSSKIRQSKNVDTAKSPSKSQANPSLTTNSNTETIETTNTTIPSTPKKRKASRVASEHKNSTHRSSSTKKKYALISLVPDNPEDDDDDDLSIISSSVAPSPFRFWPSRPSIGTSASTNNIRSSLSSTPRKVNHRHGSLLGTVTPHRVSKRTAPPATDSRAARGTKRGFNSSSGVQSSPLARTVMNMHANRESRDLLASTPSRRVRTRDAGADTIGSSPVRTPGGTARKCGEDGFVCDRDFCFTCCK